MYEALWVVSKLALAAAFHGRALAPTCTRGRHATHSTPFWKASMLTRSSDILDFLGSAYMSAVLGSPSPSQATPL